MRGLWEKRQDGEEREGAEEESRDVMFPKHLLFIFLCSIKWVRDKRE